MNKKITVIIPALNEEKTISNVIEIAKTSKNVDEVIVVDDNSSDCTVSRAKDTGATVITGTMLGKGSSMLDGLLAAKNEILVYLDADVTSYGPGIVDLLANPILAEEADFVKSTFNRKAGRVTELVAKPLLGILFPSLLQYDQPLSGMIAAKKSLLQRATFENDYGVDIGLLIDMEVLGARINEVNIGIIEHKMKAWHQLPKMSKDVARAILKRVTEPPCDLPPIKKIYIGNEQISSCQNSNKLVIFDMDNTLLKGRFIYKAAEILGFRSELENILAQDVEGFVKTKLIAKCLKDVTVIQLKSIVDSLELVDDAIEVIAELKKKGHIVFIISDSYDIVAEHIRAKVGADFAIANELQIAGGKATGEVRIPSSFLRSYYSFCNHNVCKTNALLSVATEYQIPLENCIAVGDGAADICMVKNAGIGVSFCTSNDDLYNVADYSIIKKEFKSLLEILEFAYR